MQGWISSPTFHCFKGLRMSFYGFLVFLVFPERVRFTRSQSQTSASPFVHDISWFSPGKLRKKVGYIQSEGKKTELVRHQSAKLVARLVGLEGWFLCRAQTRQDRSCLLHSCLLQESEPEGCFWSRLLIWWTRNLVDTNSWPEGLIRSERWGRVPG